LQVTTTIRFGGYAFDAALHKVALALTATVDALQIAGTWRDGRRRNHLRFVRDTRGTKTEPFGPRFAVAVAFVIAIHPGRAFALRNHDNVILRAAIATRVRYDNGETE
jgi:hypothetical protein